MRSMKIKTVRNEQLGEEMQYTVHESGLRVYVFPKKGFKMSAKALILNPFLIIY